MQKQGIANQRFKRRTSWLFTSVVEELKLWITVLQIQPVIRAGIELGISDSKAGVLTTRPRCLPTCLYIKFVGLTLGLPE